MNNTVIKSHIKRVNNNGISYHHINKNYEVISINHRLIKTVDTLEEAEAEALKYAN